MLAVDVLLLMPVFLTLFIVICADIVKRKENGVPPEGVILLLFQAAVALLVLSAVIVSAF